MGISEMGVRCTCVIYSSFILENVYKMFVMVFLLAKVKT
jgi:hypothetical protein